jgi:hypothetical protein
VPLDLLVADAEQRLHLRNGLVHRLAWHDLDQVAGYVFGDDAAGPVIDGARGARDRQFAQAVLPGRHRVLLALHDLQPEQRGAEERDHDDDECTCAHAPAGALALGRDDSSGPLHLTASGADPATKAAAAGGPATATAL